MLIVFNFMLVYISVSDVEKVKYVFFVDDVIGKLLDGFDLYVFF